MSEKLKIVGYPGRLSEKQTPARRVPVYVNDANMPATIEGRVEIGTGPISEETWSSTGTRIDPPLLADPKRGIILILGPREIGITLDLRRIRVSSAELDNEVDSFLIWIESGSLRSDAIGSIRIGTLVAWNCTPDLADALCARIANVARWAVGAAALSGDFTELRSASFWLSRAAVSDDDIKTAAAGLRVSGFEQWEDILKD